MAAPRGLSYAVDIVFCIDVTGSMSPIIDQLKANALRFYDDVQSKLTVMRKSVDQLRVQVIAFRDFVADGARQEQAEIHQGLLVRFVTGLPYIGHGPHNSSYQ
jgi:hypothetical protein